MTSDELTLEELVSQSGLPVRTVRFYMQEGLLPGPESRGKNARYTRGHLERLELIQRFKDLYLPLQQIRNLINNMSPEEISSLLQGQDRLRKSLSNFTSEKRNPPRSPVDGQSALDYIRSLENQQAKIREISDDYQSVSPKLSPSAPTKPELRQDRYSPAHRPAPQTWQRVSIRDGIELNVRYPINPGDEKKIDQLLVFVHQLFEQ